VAVSARQDAISKMQKTSATTSGKSCSELGGKILDDKCPESMDDITSQTNDVDEKKDLVCCKEKELMGESEIANKVNDLISQIDFSESASSNELKIAGLLRDNNIQIYSSIQTPAFTGNNYARYSGDRCSGTCLGKLKEESLRVVFGLGIGIKDGLIVTGAGETSGHTTASCHYSENCIDIENNVAGKKIYTDWVSLDISEDYFTSKYGFPRSKILITDETGDKCTDDSCSGSHYHIKVNPGQTTKPLLSIPFNYDSSTAVLASDDNSYDEFLDKYASDMDINANLIKAVIEVESNGNSNAESNVGAKGLMQVGSSAVDEVNQNGKTYCATFYRINSKENPDLFFDKTNLYYGICYLKILYEKYDLSNTEIALAGYNAGPTKVNNECRSDGNLVGFEECKNKLPAETQNFVPRVISIYDSYGLVA